MEFMEALGKIHEVRHLVKPVQIYVEGTYMSYRFNLDAYFNPSRQDEIYALPEADRKKMLAFLNSFTDMSRSMLSLLQYNGRGEYELWINYKKEYASEMEKIKAVIKPSLHEDANALNNDSLIFYQLK